MVTGQTDGRLLEPAVRRRAAPEMSSPAGHLSQSGTSGQPHLR